MIGAKARPLEGKRAQILETIRQRPGVNFLGIVTAHGLAHGAAAYHLRILERHGLVVSARMGRYRRYWATNKGCGPAAAQRVQACPLRQPVLERIAEKPGQRLGELAAQFPDRSRQATAYHVRRLVEAGLVRVQANHSSRHLFPAGLVQDANTTEASA